MKKFYKTVAFKHEAEDFWAIYKVSTCAVERRRAQFFAFLAEGKSETETLELTRYSVSGARQIIERYNCLVQRFVNQDSFTSGERIGDVAWNLS